MFERFTDSARRIMGLSREEALRMKSPALGTEHILIAILTEGDCSAALLPTLERLREAAVRLGASAPTTSSKIGQIPFSLRAKRSIELAAAYVDQRGEYWIGPDQLLLGICRIPDCTAYRCLLDLGWDPDEIRKSAENA